jgi:hypothetical protein
LITNTALEACDVLKKYKKQPYPIHPLDGFSARRHGNARKWKKIGKEGFFAGQHERIMLWSKYEPPRDKGNTSQY